MKPWIENLLSLQSLDMELRGIETRIATFPSEKARITAEVKSVSRVCYELTPKPVATIEFE